MPLPSFLIVGAAKAGTSALYRYVRQHPQVYASPVKEPRFFAYEGLQLRFVGPGDAHANRYAVTDLRAYEALFAAARDELTRGEASPLYLYSDRAAARIHSHVPSAKLVAILRDPTERAYSHYLHMVRDGREPLGEFAAALAAEEERAAAGWEWSWHYRRVGCYDEQLARYQDLFAGEQILVLLYEELRDEPRTTLARVFDFLGVDPTFEPDMRLRPNVTGIPRRPGWHRVLRRLDEVKHHFRRTLPAPLRQGLVRALTAAKNRNLVRPPLDPLVRRQLVEGYRPELAALEERLGRDLSAWARVS